MSLKTLLIGRPIPSYREKHERLNKALGLAVFSSDALSSVAYGPEEIVLALLVASTAVPGMLGFSVPISVAIAALVLIVATSYFQTVHAYPTSGGSYLVAKFNLGEKAGLAAGAALLIDYVLTVAVSIASGVAALVSAVPSLAGHKVLIGVAAIVVMMLINLRGVRESGRIIAGPVYLFIGSMFALVMVGLFKYYILHVPVAPVAQTATIGIMGVMPVFILLHAFASGCATLTGIEAIADGVNAFKPPEGRNAGVTLIYLAAILALLAVGIVFLASRFHAAPTENQTMLSVMARGIFGHNPFYYVFQAATAFILFLAANTSFSGLPRLSSVMADDGFLPRQLSNLGDRLVFTNGIIVLGFLASLLLIAFRGNVHLLIPLYAVGVFLGFTLCQAGMVRHWFRRKGQGWRRSAVINGIGAVVTAVVLVVITATKFIHGAWIVVLALPLLVYMSTRIRRHYQAVAEQLQVPVYYQPTEFKHHSVIIPISGVQTAVLHAIKYGKALSRDVVAVYVSLSQKDEKIVRRDWGKYGMGVKLVVLDSPFRSITRPILDYVDEIKAEHPDGIITVLMPEFVPKRWWHNLLHNQTAIILRALLHFRSGVVTIAVPLHLQK